MTSGRKDGAEIAATFERRCQAAEALSSLGYAAESEVLWRTAFEELTRAGANTSVDPAQLQAARELLEEHAVRADRARQRADSRRWQERARVLAMRCSDELRTPATRAYARPGFIAGVALFAITSIAFATKAAHVSVLASAQYAPPFGAAAARDGDLTTEWLLPDRMLGFLELALPRRRAVHRVTVFNGHNAPHMDRALRRARVVVYDDDREVDSAEINYAGVKAEPERQVAKLTGQRGTRVRVYVLEHYGLGASVAEVELD